MSAWEEEQSRLDTSVCPVRSIHDPNLMKDGSSADSRFVWTFSLEAVFLVDCPGKNGLDMTGWVSIPCSLFSFSLFPTKQKTNVAYFLKTWKL
jgi:hypothetical protein